MVRIELMLGWGPFSVTCVKHQCISQPARKGDLISIKINTAKITGMASNTVYVITGANRGIGLGLVQAYLARPSTTVVATVRSEIAAISLVASINEVEIGSLSVLHIVQLDFSKQSTPET